MGLTSGRLLVGYGMVSLMVEQKAPMSVSYVRELKLANWIDESVSVGRLGKVSPRWSKRHREVCLDDTELPLRGS